MIPLRAAAAAEGLAPLRTPLQTFEACAALQDLQVISVVSCLVPCEHINNFFFSVGLREKEIARRSLLNFIACVHGHQPPFFCLLPWHPLLTGSHHAYGSQPCTARPARPPVAEWRFLSALHFLFSSLHTLTSVSHPLITLCHGLHFIFQFSSVYHHTSNVPLANTYSFSF